MWMMNMFGGRRDPKQAAREAIVTLREQLLMNEKKEELLFRKIDEDLKVARTNATTNKAGKHNLLTAAAPIIQLLSRAQLCILMKINALY
jgi:hypothetical protein